MNQIIKRDGRIVDFDPEKIVSAVSKAMKRTQGDVDVALAKFIAEKISATPDIKTVEEIQDMVEDLLMSSDRKDAAKEYILYRAERTRQREKYSDTIQDAWKKIAGLQVENANANVDEATFGGRKNEASSALQKKIALDYNMSPDVAAAHNDGWIYQHDLDSYNVGMHNCLFTDMKHLLENGFSTRNGDVRPPSSFATACQLVAVIWQVQSQCQFGGVGSVHLDYDLAPYVAMSFKRHLKDGLRYVAEMPEEEINSFEDVMELECADAWQNSSNEIKRAWKYAVDMLEREGKQAAQGLFHNLNTLINRGRKQAIV